MFERPPEDLEDALEVFMAERTHLLRVAYRVVGDAAGAEDVVQDAWVRWQRMNRREVNNPAAWLTTATTHLAINTIQTARYRHEIPTDRPRAAVTGVAHEPMAQTEQAIAVERMLGFLMSRLTPSELAAYLLRKCFVYPYQEIAAVLRTTAPNARQLVRRAQTSIVDGRTREVDAGAHRRLVAAFTAATRDGELVRLERYLAEAAHRLPAPIGELFSPHQGAPCDNVRATPSCSSAQAA
jgi:RNA polymerase sigma-70 factor (ECF subfamily)